LSIKDDIKEVKKEFTADEQMLASAFKLEKFYKKHKIKIFSIIAIVVVAFSANKITQLIEESRLNSANEAYLTLLKDSKNSEALNILRDKNPTLFELYSYKKAVENKDIKILKELSSSKNRIMSDISKYHLSVLEKKDVNSKIYDEMATINNANILIKDGKMSQARNQLALIDEKSPVYNISKIIKHYTIKGK
jgi:hypothetical protein